MSEPAVRAVRPRALLAVLVLAASLLTGLVAAPEAARAAELGHDAALVPGTPVSLTFANPDDVASFTLAVPAGQRPWIRVTELTGMLAEFSVTSPTRFDLPRFLPGSPEQWWQELSQNNGPDDETATVSLTSNGLTGTVTFVVGLGSDVPVPVEPGVAVPVSVDRPADHPVLTFAADDLQQVTVTISDLAVTPATDPAFPPVASLVFGRPDSFVLLMQESAPGVWTGVTTVRPGPQAVTVVLGGDRTGTFTAQVDVTPAPDTALSYGAAPVTTFLDSPSRLRVLPFTTAGRVRTLVQLSAVSLRHPDGTDGTATVSLVLPGAAPVPLGTVTGTAPAVLATPDALPAGVDAALRIAGDGSTTGTLDVRLTLDAGPDVPVSAGAPTALVVPPGTPLRRLAFDAPDAGPVEVYVRDLVFGNEDQPWQAQLTVTDADGRPTFGASLDSFAPSTSFSFDVGAGRHYLEVTPQPALGGDAVDVGLTATLYVAPTRLTRLERTLPVDEVLSTSVAGDRIDVAVTVPAGHRLAARLADEQWTRPDLGDGCCAQAGLTVLDGSGNLLSGFGPFAESDVAGQDRVLHVLLDPVGLTTGSARLLMSTPTDLDGSLPAGTPTTVTVTEPGQNARLTLRGTAGLRLAVDVPAVSLTTAAGLPGQAGLTLFDPDGAEVASTSVVDGSPGWLETTAPLTTSGTYTLRVDPLEDATGRVTLTATEPRIVTRAITSGTTRTLTFARGDVQRLTFRGRAGQRPVLQVPLDLQGVETGVQILDPSGAPYERVESSAALRHVQFAPLPSTGTYTLELDPPGAAAGSLTATFVLATDQVLAGRPGRPTTTSWTVGQETRVRFGVKAGEHVAVDLRTLRATDPSTVSVELHTSRGSLTFLQLDPFTTAPQWLEFGNYDTVAAEDGVWELRFSGVGGTTGSLGYTIRTAKDQVLGGRLGRPTKVEVGRPGQNVRLTFEVRPGDVGKVLQWSVAGSTFAPSARLWLDEPSFFGGSLLAVVPPGGTTSGVGFQPLSEAGTYTLVVDPENGATGSARVTFSLGG
ncbi:MAG: hypothetical protein HY830_21125 [Actinobacteria bacterium]|nr:hypothetical protein [Actinomycetota bacterium]